MSTIQLFRAGLSTFGSALSAIAGAVPSRPTFETAGTTAASAAAVYFTDDAGSFFSVSGYGFTYDAGTGRLSGGEVYSIEYHGMGASPGSFASFSGFYSDVRTLAGLSTQANPAATVFAGSNAITSDTAALAAPGTADVIRVGGTADSRIDAGAGNSTAVFGAFRGDAALSGGGGTETAAVAGITTELVSTEQVQFLDGTVIESPATLQGQAVLAFKGIFGRVPDAINAGGYALAARGGVIGAVNVMLGTAEAQASTGGLDSGQFVARIYGNVLGRAPSDSELATARAALDGGKQTRAGLVAAVVTSSEAGTGAATTGLFAGSGVFAASPGAVDVLRAYEVLLGRLPEASSLAANATALDMYYTYFGSPPSKSVPQLYREIQGSAEFAARGANPYGLSAGSTYGAILDVAHSDALTTTNLGLISATGGVSHLVG